MLRAEEKRRGRKGVLVPGTPVAVPIRAIRLGACCQLQAAPHHMAPSHRRPFRGAAGWSSSGGKRRRWPAWNLEVSPVGSCAGGDGFRAPLIFLCLAIGIRISDGPFLWER